MPDCASFLLKQCHIFCMWQTTSAFRLLITIAHKSQRLKASVGKGAIKEAINWSSVISESGGQLNKPNKHKPTSFLYRLVQSWFTSLVLKAFSNTRTGLSITKMCPHHGTPAYCTWNEYSAPRKRGFNKLGVSDSQWWAISVISFCPQGKDTCSFLKSVLCMIDPVYYASARLGSALIQTELWT